MVCDEVGEGVDFVENVVGIAVVDISLNVKL